VRLLRRGVVSSCGDFKISASESLLTKFIFNDSQQEAQVKVKAQSASGILSPRYKPSFEGA
jgi:hypothetical protein